MSIFRVKDLRRIVDVMENDGIEVVDVQMYQRDEIEGELIGASLEFMGFGEEDEEIDYGGIEEVVEE